MIVLHANWSDSKLWLWAEDASRWADQAIAAAPQEGREVIHPGAASANDVLKWLPGGVALTSPALNAEIDLMLPCVIADGDSQAEGGALASSAITQGPAPSTKLAHFLGLTVDHSRESLRRVRVPAAGISRDDVARILDAAENIAGVDSGATSGVVLGSSVSFFASALRLVRHLLSQQRFVPALRQELSGQLRGTWQPWLSDAPTVQRLSVLFAAMPASARACIDAFAHQPWPMLEDFLGAIVDAECRRWLVRDQLGEAVESRDPSTDNHVAWLGGLLTPGDALVTKPAQRPELVKNVRRWLAGLEDRGASSTWRLAFRLLEPDATGNVEGQEERYRWPLSFHLQSVDQPKLIVDAADLWILPSDSLTVQGRRIDHPQELLLKELARAARLYTPIDRALGDSEPSLLELDTRQAYHFLREVRPLLIEQGFGVDVPPWWDWPSARLGATLKLDSEPITGLRPTVGPGQVPNSATRLGMNAIVGYGWQITVGGTTLSLEEFRRLAERKSPLVRINGQWVEIRPEDLQSAMRFIQENPGGEVRVGEALQWAFGTDANDLGIPIVGLQASGWLSAVFGDNAAREQIPSLGTPPGFQGTLRHYQERGLSWLVFLEKLGFGPCLADDMGLGKTVQFLGLMAHERLGGSNTGPSRLPPSLLIVPMSVVGNWMREAKRFCPELKFLIHHGTDRLLGDSFANAAREADAVITTYSLAARDKETLAKVHWRRIVLDEAQYIKNPGTKQTQAVMGLPSDGRVALTGTPVENRLSELWSIMEFLNPGYLGNGHAFRKRFAVPIERYKDSSRSRQLRELVRPFVLRRLKSDPTIAADLPEKLETREYSHLTTEQAELYETLVRRMLGEVERAEGIQRRGLVLATLIKLKQVCNHPGQLLKDHGLGSGSSTVPDIHRSGKCTRLVEMLDEIVAAGDKALVFTQFREMAEMLAAMLRHELDRDVLLFHGGTTQVQRDQIVHRFQRPDGQAPVLVVSLKAGGVGLNLTAATHVFHFDRWWNPAVENQATDRAHRIGQSRTVHVHKFVVRGTLEERIDEMIEQKTELARNIIGSGEDWLTELSTDQLRELFTLRKDAVGDDA